MLNLEIKILANGDDKVEDWGSMLLYRDINIPLKVLISHEHKHAINVFSYIFIHIILKI